MRDSERHPRAAFRPWRHDAAGTRRAGRRHASDRQRDRARQVLTVPGDGIPDCRRIWRLARSGVPIRETERPALVTVPRAHRPDIPMRTPGVSTLPRADAIDFADARRRIRAIVIGSIGNLVEWYDFYTYAAFALYFAPAFFP